MLWLLSSFLIVPCVNVRMWRGQLNIQRYSWIFQRGTLLRIPFQTATKCLLTYLWFMLMADAVHEDILLVKIDAYRRFSAKSVKVKIYLPIIIYHPVWTITSIPMASMAIGSRQLIPFGIIYLFYSATFLPIPGKCFPMMTTPNDKQTTANLATSSQLSKLQPPNKDQRQRVRVCMHVHIDITSSSSSFVR